MLLRRRWVERSRKIGGGLLSLLLGLLARIRTLRLWRGRSIVLLLLLLWWIIISLLLLWVGVLLGRILTAAHEFLAFCFEVLELSFERVEERHSDEWEGIYTLDKGFK